MTTKYKNNYLFPAILKNKLRGYSVVFPDFNNLEAQGKTQEEVFKNAKETLCNCILEYEEENKEIPTPTNLAKLQDQGCIILIEAFMPSARLANQNKAVSKTVTLPAWMNAKALENNINFSQLLQAAIKEELEN